MRTRQLLVDGAPAGLKVYCCDGFLQRARGRHCASAAELRCGWRLQPCNAVHTLLLREPIDAVFCDQRGMVLRLAAPLRRNRCAWQRGADSVWEFPIGVAAALALQYGSRLSLCESLPCL